MRHALIATVLVFGSASAAAQTRSQVYGDILTQQAQTLYVEGHGGLTTFESEAANSKETQATTTAGVGGWFGEGRYVGVNLTHAESTVDFSLNEASMRTAFTDVRATLRLGWLYPSIGVSVSEVQVKAEGEQALSLYASGPNAGLAVAVPLNDWIIVRADALITKPQRGFDRLDDGAEIGDRVEADASAALDLTEKLVDLVIGYKVRSYSLETKEATFEELQQGAYAGLRLGLYF